MELSIYCWDSETVNNPSKTRLFWFKGASTAKKEETPDQNWNICLNFFTFEHDHHNRFPYKNVIMKSPETKSVNMKPTKLSATFSGRKLNRAENELNSYRVVFVELILNVFPSSFVIVDTVETSVPKVANHPCCVRFDWCYTLKDRKSFYFSLNIVSVVVVNKIWVFFPCCTMPKGMYYNIWRDVIYVHRDAMQCSEGWNTILRGM